MFPRLQRIKKLAGSIFIFSLENSILSKREEVFFKESQPKGFIFFKRNIESLNSLKSLTKSLRRIDSADFFSIDEEGGRVKRLPFNQDYSLPTAKELALLDEKEIFQKVLKLGTILNYCGINMNFAPVVDLQSGENNSIVGDRSFSNNPKKVIQIAKIYIQALKKEKIYPVLKHFPGHGTTTIDSHYKLPIIDKPIKKLIEEDFLPYKILGKNVNFVMVAHLLHKDISKYPATLSKQWIKLLLNKTSFKGKIISDDFEMKALDEFSIEEKIRKTILSGISLIPICSGKEEVMLNFWETTIKIAEKESSFLSVLESLQ
jgi:beta-N-acetylhexosaminidase